MTDTPLATVDQLGAFLQQPLAGDDPSATLYLSIASGMVRDFLQRELTAVADDVVVLDPINGCLLLPELPITAVSLVETFDGSAWSTADPATYTVSLHTGIITALPRLDSPWPYGPGTWRVTYSHGFAAVPDSIVGVVLGVAARAYTSPAGVDSERIGGYNVKYSMEADGFTGIEKRALARYVNPRVA